MDRAALIERYSQGHQAMLDALAGITEQELDARPGTDDWSPREIVHHVADSEMTSALRLRKLLAEDRPTIDGYDEMLYAKVLKYANRPIENALAAIDAARRTTCEILQNMSDADWRREGTHSESGAYTAETWLDIYAKHCHDHAEQIRRARSGTA